MKIARFRDRAILCVFAMIGIAFALVLPACSRPWPGDDDDPVTPTIATTLSTASATTVPSGATAVPTVSPPSASPATATPPLSPTPEAAQFTLLVTNSSGMHVSWVDPVNGVVEQLEVGVAPWGIALGPDGRAWVATAEGVAVVDVVSRQLIATIPYLSDEEIGEARFGEYRSGGMGIAVAPGGAQVYVGVYLGDESRLEILDTERMQMAGSVPVGDRPFDVLVSRDGREVYTIDHDSFTVTVVDPSTLTARTLDAAPLGHAAFDKPHYAALAPDGRLLLPYQGQVLALLDPASGAIETIPLTANTHQHGVTLTPANRALIVGTGPAGGAPGAPSLTALDLTTLEERVYPLEDPHELVAVSPDGTTAYLTGGYTFAGGGWDGITVVDLQTGSTRRIPVPDRPLGIVVLAG